MRRFSPMIATLSPPIRFLCCRMVYASSSAWVGCSCAPSPALMITELQCRERNCAAPGSL